MSTKLVTIENLDGDGAIRLPNEVLQELGAEVGDTLYMIEEYVGSTRCFVLSKTPTIPDRADGLGAHWSQATDE